MNNIAAGLLVAALFLPIFYFYGRAGEIEKLASQWLSGKAHFSELEIKRVVGTVFGFAVAMGVAFYLHVSALRQLEKLED